MRQNATWTWTSTSPADGVASSPEDMPVEQPLELQEPPPLRTDIQAILTVIGRRIRSGDRIELGQLDLHGTDLRGAILGGAHLDGAWLSDAHLEGALLMGAHLKAFLGGVHLDGATLWDAHLEGASLVGAHLDGASLVGAHLDGANLLDAQLEAARGLTQEQVYSANLHGLGAVLPPDWPPNWRDCFRKATEQPSVTPPAP